MTPEQRIERARLVRMFLDSDEFKAAWEAVEADLVRDFRDASDAGQAVAVHEEMRAMRRLMRRWTGHESDAAMARNEIKERERPKRFGVF